MMFDLEFTIADLRLQIADLDLRSTIYDLRFFDLRGRTQSSLIAHAVDRASFGYKGWRFHTGDLDLQSFDRHARTNHKNK